MSEIFEKVPVSATLLIAFAMAFGLLTERSDAKQKGQDHDIVQTASEADSLKTLVAAVQDAGLVDALKGPGPFTVLAPADAAFAQLPEGTLEELLKPENKKRLVEILTYHVIPGKVTAAEVAKLSAAETLNGQRVDLKSTEGKVTVDGTRVVAEDIECSNGIVHVIDQVLIPSSKDLVETAAAAGDFNTLLAAVQAANLAGTLQDGGPFTVLAPTDEAFKKLPPGTIKSLLKPENQDRLVEILKYHVIPGRVYSDAALKAGHAKSLQGNTVAFKDSGLGVMANEAQVVAANIDTANGVIHVIDAVLLPASSSNALVTPHDAIEKAIAQGSQLYNSGHAEKCCEVYRLAMHGLLSHHADNMPVETVRRMRETLAKAEATHCVKSQAWQLRRGLDMAYQQMGLTPSVR